MANNTKEKILDAALELFAQKGYEGTNIKDIADEVGLVKSALYRHFTSKQQIWTAVFQNAEAYYEARFGSADNLPGSPRSMAELAEMTRRMVDFTVHDPRIIRMRQLLLTEQFRDDRVRRLASKYFLYDTEAIFTKVFEQMMACGAMKKGSAEALAFAYSAPVTALVHLCDRDPEKEGEAMARLEAFMNLFAETYGTEKESGR